MPPAGMAAETSSQQGVVVMVTLVQQRADSSEAGANLGARTTVQIATSPQLTSARLTAPKWSSRSDRTSSPARSATLQPMMDCR